MQRQKTQETANIGIIAILFILAISATLLLTACGGMAPAPTETPTIIPSTTPSPTPSPTVTATLPPPSITSVTLNQDELPRYAALEMTVKLQALQINPYDIRLVRLDGVFSGPEGIEMSIPGFWDSKGNWKVRFTPSQVGEWHYKLVVTDQGGSSTPFEGTFNVTSPDPETSTGQALHGWLQVGNMVDPSYSSRYLVYHDGAPFYGIGYGEALNILTGGFSLERGVPVFNKMNDAGENYVVWWPLYSNSPVNGSYSQYASANMDVIDIIVKDAQKKNIFLIFTIWDHPELRDNTHAWGPGQWPANGFNKLGDINSFFTSDEAWAWQQNLYRYIIARWGYSPAIGMWQTVSEINGTNAYDQTNPWHEKVNAYFVTNDPYRHPTTASMSGDVDWPEGHQAMDVPQVHLYDFTGDTPASSGQPLKIDDTHAAEVLAHWTQLMWNQAAKPNWVGEFGAPGDQDYPELFHNANWAALASGAAMTPAEWNGGGAWGEMTKEMNADLGRLAQFVADIPLAKLNPSPLTITLSDAQVRAWGIAGTDGGLFWVQDFSLEGKTNAEIRADETVRQGIQAEISGFSPGTYSVTPYDTWQGQWLTALQVLCESDTTCTINLPNFHADMAFKLERQSTP